MWQILYRPCKNFPRNPVGQYEMFMSYLAHVSVVRGGWEGISSHLNTVHEMATPYPLHFGVFFLEFCYD